MNYASPRNAGTADGGAATVASAGGIATASRPGKRRSNVYPGQLVTLQMRPRRFALSILLLGMLFASAGISRIAFAQDGPVGSWMGAVNEGQRNIAVTLDVTALRLGAPSGQMRWGAPRTCSLQTEYAGQREGGYALNIPRTNGGWCDLYRDGQLLLQAFSDPAPTLKFTLSDKQGGRLVNGTLAPKPLHSGRDSSGRP